MKAVIICSGSICDYDYIRSFIERESYIICCDGGLRHCRALEIEPDVIVGDFDSADLHMLKKYAEKGAEILKVPAEKDFTDGELGVVTALKRGAESITVLGGTGTRLDHTLGNIHILKTAMEQGVFARLIDEHNITMLNGGKMRLELPVGTTVSLIPFDGDAEGVSICGVHYPLRGALLKTGTTLGISNLTEAEVIEIYVEKGILIVIAARD